MTTPARPTPDHTTITTLLALPPDLVERDRVRRQALRVAAVHHAGLARLREVAFAGEGLALTWQVQGQPLAVGDAAVVALAPVAAGLALLHDAGLAHGGISADAVLVHEGRGAISGWRPGGSPERDVSDLVALLDASLPAASVGADIAQLIVAGSDPDPAVRPSMASIAATLERASVHVSPPLSPPAHRRARPVEAPGSHGGTQVDEQVRASASMPSVRATRGVTDRRGRHAARRSPRSPVSVSGMRLPWRWGVALAGAAVAAFLGLSAVGSAGSAQPICPAPAGEAGRSSLEQGATLG